MKKIKIEMILTTCIVIIMVFLAEFFQEKEFIFPEITALAIGAWLAPHQSWKVNKIKIWLLISLHAIIGVCIVRYLPIDLWFQINLGFIICLLSLYFSKSTFAPLISATVLPILMKTTSWLYPLSASIMTLIIVVGQFLLERTGIKVYNTNLVVHNHFQTEMKMNIQRLIVVMILSFVAIQLNCIFMIAPPLIVGFIELTHIKTKLRNHAGKLILTIFLCGLAGSLSRYIGNVLFHFPLTVCSLIATILMLIILYQFHIFFPPAGAITILPMLIDESLLLIYPLQTTCGFIIMVIIALIISKQSLYKNFYS